MPKARQAAETALKFDDTLAEAHTALGYILYHYEYDFPRAEQEFRRALQLNPNYATAHHWYAGLLTSLERWDEADPEFRRAIELDPVSLIVNRHYGDGLLYARRFDDSVAQLNKTLELDPNFAAAHYGLGLVFQAKKEYAKSAAAYARYQELIGNPQNAAAIRESFARGGWDGFLKRMTQADPPIFSPFFLASFYSQLGDKDKAFEQLNLAYENREFNMVHLRTSPLLDLLRGDPRFDELLKKVNLYK